MTNSPSRIVPVNVVDNPSASALPGNPIMSGGLGGTVTPRSASVPRSSGGSGQRAMGFMHALQREVRSAKIDLSGIHYSPFIRDVTESPRFYLKDPSRIVNEIEDAMLRAAVMGRNRTQIGLGIGGGAKRVLFIAVKKMIREAKSGKIKIVGLNANPSGSQSGRPGLRARL